MCYSSVMAKYLVQVMVKESEKTQKVVDTFKDIAKNKFFAMFVTDYESMTGVTRVIVACIVAEDSKAARLQLWSMQALTNEALKMAELLPFFGDTVSEVVAK